MINIEKAKSSDRPRGPRTERSGGHHSYPAHPYAAYDSRSSSQYPLRARSNSRRSRSRSPPRSGYADYGRGSHDYGYPPSHDTAAHPYGYPPHPAYDPYGYQPYGQPSYGYGAPPSSYHGSYMPGSSSNRSRSPYRRVSSRSPPRHERHERGNGYNRRPRATDDSSSAASAPTTSSTAAPAYSDTYPAAAQ